MSRVLYLDCFSGIAGDMLLAALIDAGLPADELRAALGSLGVGCELRLTKVLRAGITATRFEVLDVHAHPAGESAAHHDHPSDEAPHAHGHDGHRSLKEIVHLIGHSSLSAAARARATELFTRLATAEAAIHDLPLEEVHLHEVGAVDSIIDIVGAVFALEWFGIDDIVSSPLNVGGGTVEIAHGRFPVPAPATAALLRDVPIYSDGPRVELVTPTGALLVSGYARSYGPVPAMRIARVGYGAGTRDFAHVPNVVRVLIGERAEQGGEGAAMGLETVTKIECEIDDMNPQLFAVASDRLFAAGALDVYLTAIQMKKGRPGTLITVLAEEARRATLCTILFRETTTLGVRFETMRRETLERRSIEVATSGGPVRIKVATRHGEVINAAPEFDDCLRIAERTGRPVKDVQAEAMRVWSASPAIE
jgi:uncharacterized protein (TIGR00299 family) protein